MCPAPLSDGILACSPRHDKLTRHTLEIDVGIDQVKEALELATYTDSPDEPPTPMRQLLERLGDPTFAHYAITTLMREVGVSLPALLEAVRKRDVQLAIVNSGKRIAPVLDGIGEAAEPKWAICPRCGGEGEVVDERAGLADPSDPDADPVMVKCYMAHGGCDGSGKVRLSGNLDAAKVFLGVHGMAASGKGAGGGVVVDKLQVTQINNPPGDDRRNPQKPIEVTATVQRILENGS